MSFDLSTKFAGLELKSPIVVGSCPMTAEELQRIAMISNGAGAVVLPSLFEEQFVVKTKIAGSPQYDLDSYLKIVACATKDSSIPIIASINGRYSTDWRKAAEQISRSGAQAIEFCIRQAEDSLESNPRAVEDGIVTAVESIKRSIDIPLVVKLTRGFTSISNLAGRLKPHVSGVVLFGRVPVIDVELDSLKQTSKWGLTESGTIVNSLDPIMRIRNHHPDLSIAACGGIGGSTDLIKALLAGANVGMVTSAIYRDGATVIGSLLQGLTQFMESHNICSLTELANTQLVRDAIKEPDPATRTEVAHDTPKQTLSCDRFGHVEPTD